MLVTANDTNQATRDGSLRGAHLSVPVCHCIWVSDHVEHAPVWSNVYLGENVVSENEYLSAMARCGMAKGRGEEIYELEEESRSMRGGR